MTNEPQGRTGPMDPDRGGYVLATVMVAVVVLTIISTAGLSVASDERAAARAMRESGSALMAADNGASLVMSDSDPYLATPNAAGSPVKARRSSVDSIAQTLAPGQTYDFGWEELADGTSFRSVLRRCDAGGQPLYTLTVDGEGLGRLGGARSLRMLLTESTAAAVPTSGIVVDGDLEISGTPTVQGACSTVHANGNLIVGGTLTTEGDVSASRALLVSGTETVSDSLIISDTTTYDATTYDAATLDATYSGMLDPNTTDETHLESGAELMHIPALDPMTYCGEADFKFSGGIIAEQATGIEQDASIATVHGWNYSSGTYVTGSDNVSPGTICSDGNFIIGNNLGTGANPLPLTLLTTGSVSISANPYIDADHSEGVAIVAGGDVMLGGSATASWSNYGGIFYAGSQCELSGDPRLDGLLTCKDEPNPAGSEDWVAANKINGGLGLGSACTVEPVEGLMPVPSRAILEVW